MNRRTGLIATGFAFVHQPVAAECAWMSRARGDDNFLAIDIDKLKAMNDAFGHQAGDELIRVVAGALQRAVRRGDVAARVGGDEFWVILADADAQHAEAVAQSNRR
jgi:diguanylate cyclase (GGDEF)-like protein